MKKAICVLGMHRSGTSMIMRLLNILGVYIGKDEDVLSFGEDNPEGFWEHRGIVSIHEKILGSLGRSWDNLMPLPNNWLSHPEVLEYKQELVTLLKHEFATAPIWGWKDPRTCLLLPLWNEVYRILDIEVNYIIPTRNPLDIANSLFSRNGIERQDGIALWYYYMVNIVDGTNGHQRCLLSYDSMIEKPLDTAREIAKFIGSGLDEQSEQEIVKSIKPHLRHSKSSYKELAFYSDEWIASYYRNLDQYGLSKRNEKHSFEDYKNYARLFGLDKRKDEILRLKEKLIEVEKNQKALSHQIEKYKEQNNVLHSTINEAMSHVIKLSTTKLLKLVHLGNRINHQVIKGNFTSMKQFFGWLVKRQNKKIYMNDHRYNPMYQIVDILSGIRTKEYHKDVVANETNRLSINVPQKGVLEQRYEKYDILFLSVIDYDFRFQRPQHLAKGFAERGHRVFYCNPNFHRQDMVTRQEHGLLTICNLRKSTSSNIYETVNSAEHIDSIVEIIVKYAIRDCVVVVEYPTWLQVSTYLKQKFGFKVVVDYLDDYLGFEFGDSNQLTKSTVELLSITDCVVASSNFLSEKARQYNTNIEIVRNGTEFHHFNQAFTTSFVHKKRKVVGYYGAISHWFDIGKIEYIADRLPDVEVILIGEVTIPGGIERFSKYANIKFLGEINYHELPKYLQQFDVSIIPFDTTTDLIKATNPVKFYEYLSAGKKVVATEIPELSPYKDKFVYLANDNEKFLSYVELCLAGTDNLAPADECIEFALENTWEHRIDTFLACCDNVYPKVSIIILTFNQIEFTKKCIESILNKTAYPNYEIIVVDNCSNDGTRDYLAQLDEQYRHIRVLLNDENYGFAGGNNIGLKNATGDYFILLNNDTIVTRGWITNFLKHFDTNPNLGLLGPVTNSIGNEAMIKAEYESLDKMEEFAYSYTTKVIGQLYRDISTLAMFCIVIPKNTFEAIGFLDENYKVGMFEDDDYSMAAKEAGFDLACAEDVFIHHFGSVSFKKLEDTKYKEIFEGNKKYYEDKWRIKWVPHKYRDGVL